MVNHIVRMVGCNVGSFCFGWVVHEVMRDGGFSVSFHLSCLFPLLAGVSFLIFNICFFAYKKKTYC